MKKEPIDKLVSPVSKFIHLEYTSGIVLFMGVLIAIAWVNSPWGNSYHHIWEIKFSLGFDEHVLSHPLHLWINDGLMAIFFFVTNYGGLLPLVKINCKSMLQHHGPQNHGKD